VLDPSLCTLFFCSWHNGFSVLVHPCAVGIVFPWCLGSCTFGSLFTQVEDDSSVPWLLNETLHGLRLLFVPNWNCCYLWHFFEHHRMVLGFARHPTFWTAIQEHHVGIHEFLPLLEHYVHGVVFCSFQSGYYYYLWHFFCVSQEGCGACWLSLVLDSNAGASRWGP